jgi:hypothetical protein
MGGDVRSWSLFYQCPWAPPFSCAWQPNVGVDVLHNTLRCAHSLNAVTSDYGATPPSPDVKLNIGLTRRDNTLLGGTGLGATGRGADFLSERTTLVGAVCGGADAPPGGVAVNSSVAYALVL